MGAPVITTTYRGEVVEVPATIRDVRAFLPEERREAFTAAAEACPPEDLAELLIEWVDEFTDTDPAVTEAIAKARAGDRSGTITHEAFMDSRHVQGAA